MSVWKWVKIIAKILELLADGMSEEAAVNAVASMSGVSAEAIWNHGGF